MLEAYAAGANPAALDETTALAEKLEVVGARTFATPRDGSCGPAGLAATLDHAEICAATGGRFPEAQHLAPYAAAQRMSVVDFAQRDFDAMDPEERVEKEGLLAITGFPGGFSHWATTMRSSGGYADAMYLEYAGRLFNAIILVTRAGDDGLGMVFPENPAYLRPNPR